MKEIKTIYFLRFFNQRRKLLVFFIFFLLNYSFVQAQIVISEIFFDGNIQLTNNGDAEVDVSTYWLCDFPTYEQISNLNVECGNLVIPAGGELVLSGFNIDFISSTIHGSTYLTVYRLAHGILPLIVLLLEFKRTEQPLKIALHEN